MIEITALQVALADTTASGSSVTLRSYAPSPRPEVNEYCLFLKPELTELRERLPSVLSLISEILEKNHREVVAASSTIAADYLKRHSLMEQHYGVIKDISRRGVPALSSSGRKRLEELFGAELGKDLIALGGHQFLERYPFFTSDALAVLYENLQNIKLAPGSHCVRATVRGQACLIFNGFHPEQIDRYTRSGSTIAPFVIRSTMPWTDIRNVLTGATNPAKAHPLSIRGQLYARRAELHLAEVSSAMNGVHVSAGPVEAMVEVCRYMSDFDRRSVLEPEETTFGHLLLAHGITREHVRVCATNPEVAVDGRRLSLFDATEERDAVDAADIIAALNTAGTLVP